MFGVSLFALATTGQPIYSRLSYFLTLLLAGNWIWSRLALQGVTLERKSYLRRGQVGQIFEERFDLHNSMKLPRLLIEVNDGSDLPGSPGSRVHTLIGGKQGRSYLGRTRLVERGVFTLGPTKLISGDPFGLFPVSRVFQAENTLMVYPMMVEIETFPRPPGLLPGGEALRRRTHQVTPNSATVREYAPGDSLNRIHWKTTARKDKLMVKEFELDPLAEVWVFLDGENVIQSSLPYTPVTDVEGALFQEEKYPSLAPSTVEYGACVAASVARYYLRRGRAVGLFTTGHLARALPPDRSSRQLDKILETLAMYKADGEVPFTGLVSNQCRHLPRGSTIVLITPSVREDVPLVVDQLIRLGLRPVVVLIDAETFNGSPGTDRVETAIASLGIPVATIANGDDLGETLSLLGVRSGDPSLVPTRRYEIL
jgi:uncharacterized protein (DUF58 family)